MALCMTKRSIYLVHKLHALIKTVEFEQRYIVNLLGSTTYNLR